MKETYVRETVKVDLKDPVLIEGLPGMGMVGLIAVRFLIKQFGATRLAELYSPHFPYYVLVNKKGSVRLLRCEFFSCKNPAGDNDLVFLVSDARRHRGESELDAADFLAMVRDKVQVVKLDPALLNAEGPYSDEQRRAVQEHVALGVQLVAPLAPWPQVLEIVHAHHERHDGRGYPRGLRGDEVPLAGMIMNIADQYEALRSVRPYKPSLTHERVVEILTQGDGRTIPGHFHPLVLAAFRDSTDRFAAIFEEFEAED